MSEPASGTRNMAMDEALMQRAARTGDGVFRVYSWSRPTLSLGRNQHARGVYDVPAAQSLGIDIVRRPTGGRALLHDHEITYSATMPVTDVAEAKVAYSFINEVLLSAVVGLGVRASLATETAAIPPGPRPCFDVPSEREIVVDGRKLIGSAQWRDDGALLQHGSILVRDDQALIPQLMREAEMPPPRAATLSEALGYDPQVEELAHLIRQALAQRTSTPVDMLPEDSVLEVEAERRAVIYADDAWTWRR